MSLFQNIKQRKIFIKGANFMKFINFNQEAMNCLSERQKRRFSEVEQYLSEQNAELNDPATKELYIVCLSYDNGVRLNHNRHIFHDLDAPEFVVVENEINCEYVAIQYSKTRGHWVLNLNPKIQFKTLEDALIAAELCVGGKTKLERLKLIAENFPEFADDIAEDIELFEAIKNGTPDYSM